MQETKANRKYKDRLFRFIFQNKEDLLSLYNAVNHSNYEDPDLLEITTLDDVLYLGMKNDISFLIDSYMNLYEAQSTWNPNMPLRGLFYFSRLYSSYVESRQLDIYSGVRLKLPAPRYLVFYNGTRREAEVQTLRLSSSFEKPLEEDEAPCLECIATVLNINYGHNEALMKQCRKLYEYSYLVNQIRRFLAKGVKLETAIDLAIKDCLQHNILADFLTRHREEAKLMILSEYNEELHRKTLIREGLEEGRREGRKEGLNNAFHLFHCLEKAGRMDDWNRALDEPEFCNKLLEEFHLNENTLPSDM